jgi:outer membrane lipoprotein-sorting protein
MIRRQKSVAIAGVAVSILAALATGCVYSSLAAPLVSTALVAMVEPEKMGDGAEFLSAMDRAAGQWNSYTCESHLEIFKTDKTSKSGCKVFYKDKQMRIEVVGGGYRDGSVVVRRRDGTIRAKGGWMLGGIEMNLDPDSRMLVLQNGTNVMRTNLPDLVTEFKEMLRRGCTSRVSALPVQDQSGETKVYVLEIYEPAHSPANLTRRVFVDSNLKIPLRIDAYVNGKLASSASFKNMNRNAGLSDDLFQL